ncbi:hypothetical protein GCM10017566_56380 [Amycolatopsis bartoniae]|uniref:Uncharacterized protein n=1 Tax=Amycolatopsis bartoniae TaxID=941986 RepID=A0A8H9IXU9_9PSEU|nr:hypothetical protein GCM10017566_56380 [Amycolatopsis bartoniae]
MPSADALPAPATASTLPVTATAMIRAILPFIPYLLASGSDSGKGYLAGRARTSRPRGSGVRGSHVPDSDRAGSADRMTRAVRPMIKSAGKRDRAACPAHPAEQLRHPKACIRRRWSLFTPE